MDVTHISDPLQVPVPPPPATAAQAPAPAKKPALRAAQGMKPFIPALMDDADLTAQQFRVVCRVARRGECTESIRNIAAGCRLAIGTVKKVLPFLVAINALAKEKRPGQTSIFKVNPTGEWRVEPRPNGNPGQKTTQHLKQPGTKSNSLPSHLGQSAAHKGTPYEGNPLKGPSPNALEDWKLEKDEERLRDQIKRLTESSKPDPALLALKRSRLNELREEMKRRRPLVPTGATKPIAACRPLGMVEKTGTMVAGKASEGMPLHPSPELAAKFRKEVEEAMKNPTVPEPGQPR